ncbi:MAG: response regulator, partial [Bacteroidota bacterium]
ISAWSIHTYRSKKIWSDKQKLQKLVEERTSSLEKATQVEKQSRAEAEKARKEAEKANNAKSLFLANMSHEIRTPLNGVLGMVQLLSDTNLDEEQTEYIDTVQKSSESLLGVINDILDFSKIESGKMTLEAVSFNIRACLEEVVQLYVAKVLETQIRLVYSVDHRIPATISADKIRLKQILSNLVSNALKFTQDGYVEIFIGLPEHAKEGPSAGSPFQLDIWVKDSGIGISREKQKQLFNAFSQADNSITRKYGGTGLGLAICQKLSQLMGGDIEVSSTPGAGSTFHFWIQCSLGEDLLGPIYQSFAPHHGKVILTRFLNQPCSFSMYHHLKGLGFEPVQIQEPHDIPTEMENVYCLIMEYDCWKKEESHWREWRAKQSTSFPMLLGHTFGLPLSERTRDFFDGLFSYPLAYKAFTQTLFNLQTEGLSSNTFQTPAATTSLESDFAEHYPLSLMVAEDNPVNQKLIKRVLEKLGYKIEMASNGKLAVEMYKDVQPDLIFMDIQMPEMDGVTACKEIRKLSQLYSPPHIIAMTANAMKGDRETFLAAGMDDYIAKPFKIQEVKEVLKAHSLSLREKSS